MSQWRIVRALLAVALSGLVATWSARAADLEIGSATGFPGQLVSFSVTLNVSRLCVYSLDHVIGFSPLTAVASLGGGPDCRLPGTLVFYDAAFGFDPAGCTVAGNCTGMFFSGAAIDPSPPDVTQIYTCRVHISPNATPGDYPLSCVRQSIGNCTHEPPMTEIDCSPGVIHVLGCAGDCNSDGSVSIDELLMGVSIALGSESVAMCPAMDKDGNGNVSISELTGSVAVALEGCDTGRFKAK